LIFSTPFRKKFPIKGLSSYPNHPQTTKRGNSAHTKRLGFHEGRGYGIKRAKKDFLLKNGALIVSVTQKTINGDIMLRWCAM